MPRTRNAPKRRAVRTRIPISTAANAILLLAMALTALVLVLLFGAFHGGIDIQIRG